MNRHDRRAMRSRGSADSSVRFEIKARMILEAGHYWALSENFCVRIGAVGGPFAPPPETISPAPKEFAGYIAACPGEEARVLPQIDEERERPHGERIWKFGSVDVAQRVMWGVTGFFKEGVEWRATSWTEPVYALLDGVVVGLVMGLDRPAIGDA